MDRLIKQEIVNLLKIKKINYPIYVLDGNNRKRKISDVFACNGSIFFEIDGHVDSLIIYSSILQYNLYKELKNNINDEILTD